MKRNKANTFQRLPAPLDSASPSRELCYLLRVDRFLDGMSKRPQECHLFATSCDRGCRERRPQHRNLSKRSPTRCIVSSPSTLRPGCTATPTAKRATDTRVGDKLRQRARFRVMVDHLLSGTNGGITLLGRRSLRTQAAAPQYRDESSRFMTFLFGEQSPVKNASTGWTGLC